MNTSAAPNPDGRDGGARSELFHSEESKEGARALDIAHGRLLEAVRSAERARQWNLFLAIGMIAFAGATLFLLVSTAISAGSRSAPADDDIARIAKVVREVLREGSVKPVQGAPIPAASTGGPDSGGELVKLDASGDGLGELDRVKQELASAKSAIADQERRALEEQSALDKIAQLVDSKRRAVNDGNAVDASKGAESKPSSAPASPAKLTDATVRELNSLFSYATQSNLRLMDADRVGKMELSDAVFAKTDMSGRAAGLVTVKRVKFEESATEPRLRMRLEDGQDIVGQIKMPFASRVIDFRTIDPVEWKRRIPEIFTTEGVAAAVNAVSTAMAEDAVARNAKNRPLIVRINQLLAAHTDYVHLRLDDLTLVDGDSLYGVTFVMLVKDRGAAEPRVDQQIRARRMNFLYTGSTERLELELEDGTRGSTVKQMPFPGGKLRLLVPGVRANELEGGDPPIPIRRG